MKKFLIYFIGSSILFFSSCQKSELQIVNPNAPTPASLATEAGINSFALGLYQKWIADVPGEGGTNIMFATYMNHSIMGDELFCPYGNWGWRWADQVYAITLPAPYNTKIVNPNGVTQKVQLQSTNSRQAGERNSFLYEWEVSYFVNAQANLLLSSLENSALSFSGDATTKRNTLKAWAYWWKGFVYSRIGSMYISGIINNEPANGNTNGSFVTHDALITEANANFDKALTILQSLSGNADYQATMDAVIPSFNKSAGPITPQMWVRQINSYKARNFLVNHKVKAMTTADWNQVLTLASAGLQSGDNVFMFGMSPDATNDLSANFFHPFAIHATGNGFGFVSERQVQDYNPGDNRLNNFVQYQPQDWKVNIRGRGLQFGTRWYGLEIENGGKYATNISLGTIPFACSWEETALMVAEAKIRLGQTDAGLQIVDQVRTAQGAGLAAVANTGLTQAQALEELRKERRAALFLRGLAFYDARRLGITEPASAGGGRNGIVLIPGNLIGGTAAQPLNCFIEYNYMDYFDVPQNELDFNVPAPNSAPVKQ